MFIVTNALNEQIGLAYPISNGYEIKIFNRDNKLIIKENKKESTFHTFVKVQENYFMKCGYAHWDKFSKNKIKFEIDTNQYAFITFNSNSTNLNFL